MNKKLILTSSAFLAFAISQPVLAMHHDKMMKNDCNCSKKMDMYKELNLTDQQKASIKAIHHEYEAKLNGYHAKMQNMRMGMYKIIKSDKIDEDMLNDMVNQKKEVVSMMTKTKIEMKHKMYMVLDQKQKAKLEVMKKNYMHEKNKMMKMNTVNDDMMNDD